MAEKTKEAVAPKMVQEGGVTRTAAITQALATLGKDALPMQIKAFIKEKFGIEMSNNAASAYKSEINRKAGRAKSATPAVKPVAPAPAAKKGPAPKPPETPAPAPVAKKPAPAPAAKKVPAPKPRAKPAPATGSNGKARGIELTDIQAVKNLVGRVGPDQLKTLIDVLSK